ncbi:DMT family transporter [Achromobacter spanius]|uniref:DMT family transporter n=1 Tax=Achromobacter spanius TaxID=217203 RepID=UPI0032084816
MNTDRHLRPAFSVTQAPAACAAKSTGALPFLLGSGVLGTIGVFVHMAGAGALTATWFRCAFGLAGLTVWMLVRGRGRALRLAGSTAPLVLGAAALMVLSWVLFFAAIERTSAGMAVVLFHMQPMWVLLLGAVWLHERSSRHRLVSVFVAMGGLVLATGVLEHDTSALSAAAQAGYWWGVAFCLVGSICTACAAVMVRRLGAMPAGVLAWWQCALGTAVLWIWPMQQGWPAWGASWLWLAGLGLIHTAAAYTLIYTGMARLNTGRIAVFQFVYPAVAILIDWLYFDRRFGSLQLAGIAIMAVAIWNAERGGK